MQDAKRLGRRDSDAVILRSAKGHGIVSLFNLEGMSSKKPRHDPGSEATGHGAEGSTAERLSWRACSAAKDMKLVLT